VVTELDRRGVVAAVGAYSIWGLFPAFWPLLEPAVPVEVLAHRIMWTAVLMVGVIAATRGWSQLRALRPRGWAMVAAAGALITVNWGLYIYAVFAGQVVEAALGYFMSPLVSVLLGVLVLRERPRSGSARRPSSSSRSRPGSCRGSRWAWRARSASMASSRAWSR
jgi:chloramphenicol-sensitive protein RarD